MLSVAGASLIATRPGPEPPLEPAETATPGPSARGLLRSQGKPVAGLRVGVRVVDRTIVRGAHIECRVEQLSVRRPHRGLGVRRFVLGGHPADRSPTGGRALTRSTPDLGMVGDGVGRWRVDRFAPGRKEEGPVRRR